MKNILIVFMLGLILGVNAQDKTFAMPINKVSGEAYTYASTSVSGVNAITAFTAADTISSYDSTYSIVIYPNLDNSYEYYIRLKLLRSTGSATAQIDSITLQGRMFDTESWTTIRNVKWFRSTADTTIYFSGLITGTLTGTSIYDTTKIMNHVTPALKSLYYANESLIAQQKTKYRQLRIYATMPNSTVGRSKFDGLEVKFIK